MHRRTAALVFGAVAAIVGGAWWLSASPVEPAPPPVSPVAPRVEAAPSPPPIVVTPSPLEAPPDAGALAEVAIEVVQNGRQLVGTRVELEGPGGRVSRPTDVMGFARFTLPEGAWRIVKPRLPAREVPYDGGAQRDWQLALEQSTTAPLEVIAPLTQYRHELPSLFRYRVRVVDGRGAPVPAAKVTWGGRGTTALTDTLGEARFESTEQAVQVQAALGNARSIVRAVAPERVLTLVLEAWTYLEVKVRGPGGGATSVQVVHRDEVVGAGLLGEPMPVPVGALEVLVRRTVKGRLLSGKARVETRDGLMNEVEIELAPTPPITGEVVDAAGRPLPGVGVHFREVSASGGEAVDAFIEAVEYQLKAEGTDGGLARLPATTRTDASGRFTWTPDLGRGPDPIFQLLVVENWRTSAEAVLVKLDDAPLTVEVVPAP